MAPSARRLQASACCASVNFGFRPMRCPRFDRRELLKMLKALAPGDVVTVTRIDRLARSTFDLFAIVKQIVEAKAQFRSLAEPWADTGTQHRALDDCCSRRPRGRGARPYPHPHCRGQKPGNELDGAGKEIPVPSLLLRERVLPDGWDAAISGPVSGVEPQRRRASRGGTLSRNGQRCPGKILRPNK